MAEALTPQQAMIWLMVVVSAADRDMTDDELARIGAAVRDTEAFGDFDEDDILPAARDCRELLQQPDGLARVLGGAARAIPSGKRATAYALAFEIATVDGKVRVEERRILQILRGSLGLDEDIVAEIEQLALRGPAEA